ncbi:hypothetical protein [Enhygromyxa salina]|uniref:Uncharacterized protein n=1 Tax=Enhygromyxa salina TaxID=215803 RepID=A0A2S9YKH6_9BACT|nr:hypothetical protein [Enhygromyxa salina]PRQ05516.1 hypothetical protein ENSA7_45620 [Enhygromyxa salina]
MSHAIRQRSEAAPLVLLAWLTALTTGCAGEDALDPCSYQVCSIDDPACIERVAEAVACKLDAAEVVVPKVRMLTAAEVVAEIEAGLETPTPEQVRDITDYFLGEALLGLMPADYEYTPPQAHIADWAIAYYSVTNKEIVVITDNLDGDPEQAYLVMVHEMIHVYQDEGRNLEALLDAHATTYDRFLGLRAAIEGEASFYDSLAEIELAGLASSEIDWAGYYARWQGNVLELAAATEQPSLDAVALFPYSFGSAFMFAADQDAGRGGVEAVFGQPPDSVRQVQAGHDRWPDQARNRDDLLDTHAAPKLPDRYEFLGGGHESAWLLNTMLQRTTGAAALWSAVVADVSADYLSVFRDADTQALVAVWRIQTDAAPNLTNVLLGPSSWWVAAQSGEPASHVVTQVDGDVVLVAISDAGDANLVIAEIEAWQSPGELAAGAPDSVDVRLRRRGGRDILELVP